MSLFRPNIDAMAAYVPGEQPGRDADVVKLNTNENPYPPSPRVAEAARAFDYDRLRLYPQPVSAELCAAAAEAVGVEPDWILPGNGSDDVIAMLARAVAGAGRRIAYPVPTFTFYETQARVEDAAIAAVPYEGDDFALPVDALAAADAALTFVASPNSPTGIAADLDRLDALAGRLRGVLAIDEAYVAFADGSAVELARRRDNVILLRTLSKGYSLAGLRVGFGVGNPGLLAGVAKAKQIYNLDALAAEIATAALRDPAHKQANAGRIRAGRAELTERLAALGLTVWPSQANFVMARPAGGEAGALAEALKQRGVLVRYFGPAGAHLPPGGVLRITVGTDAQNRRLLTALEEIVRP